VSNVSECLDGRTEEEDGGRRRRKVHSHKEIQESLNEAAPTPTFTEFCAS
jgi:hypothetical protein